jgi:hypothetical protein
MDGRTRTLDPPVETGGYINEARLRGLLEGVEKLQCDLSVSFLCSSRAPAATAAYRL